jgi:hypothetical protein
MFAYMIFDDVHTYVDIYVYMYIYIYMITYPIPDTKTYMYI